MKILLRFYTDSIELLLVFWSWSEDTTVCMWLAFNSQIIFVTFSQVELSHISGIFYNKVNGMGYLVGATPPTVLYFTGVLEMVRRYAHGLDIIFRLCFVTFFAS